MVRKKKVLAIQESNPNLRTGWDHINIISCSTIYSFICWFFETFSNFWFISSLRKWWRNPHIAAAIASPHNSSLSATDIWIITRFFLVASSENKIFTLSVHLPWLISLRTLDEKYTLSLFLHDQMSKLELTRFVTCMLERRIGKYIFLIPLKPTLVLD